MSSRYAEIYAIENNEPMFIAKVRKLWERKGCTFTLKHSSNSEEILIESRASLETLEKTFGKGNVRVQGKVEDHEALYMGKSQGPVRNKTQEMDGSANRQKEA